MCFYIMGPVKFPPVLYIVLANSDGSGETVRMRRFAWAFPGRFVISTIFSWAGSFDDILGALYFPYVSIKPHALDSSTP